MKKALNIKQCEDCFFKDYIQLKGGARIICRIDGHKIKKGKSDCKDFKWS